MERIASEVGAAANVLVKGQERVVYSFTAALHFRNTENQGPGP